MSKIFPFAAWRYSLEQFSDLSRVIAPPYDVIGPEEQRRLYEKSPFNVAWVDLPPAVEGQDKYQGAGERFAQWCKTGVLVQEERPCYYLYFQTFTLPDGRKLTRRGFFGRRLLESFESGSVRPHEQTFPGPKADRFQLMKATHANLSPIFGLYNDAENRVGHLLTELSQRSPDFSLEEENGQQHQVWIVSEIEAQKRIQEALRDRPILIADGHHRYETALAYRDACRVAQKQPLTGQEPFEFVMMYFCSLQDPGLVILPTHRLLKERPEGDLELYRRLLGRYGEIRTYKMEQYDQVLQDLASEGKADPTLAWVHDDSIEIITFDRDKILESQSLNLMHHALRDLDVTLLHHLVLQEVMGISLGSQREYGTLEYIKDSKELVEKARQQNTFGFLLNPTKMAQVQAVTEIGEVMPQKSTYFYPKLLTGLLFCDLSDR